MLACERGNTTPSVCSCAPRRSPVCAPAINWRARASPALQLLCAARRSVAQGWQGRAGGDTSGCAVTLGLPGLLPRQAGLVRTCRWLAGCSSSLRNLGNFGEPTKHQDPLDIQVLGTVLGHHLERDKHWKMSYAVGSSDENSFSESIAYF